MKQSSEFDDILNECLERMLVNGETLEQCLSRFPEQSDNLRPLLETALAVQGASALQPRAEFRERARYQLHSILAERERQRSRRFSWQPRWATAIAIGLVLLLVSSTGVAANSSMPDQLLYPVKLATEQVRLTFTFSALGKAELYARFSDRRVTEIIHMAREGKVEQIERTAQRLDACLARMASLASVQMPLATAQVPSVETAPEPAPSLTAPSPNGRMKDGGMSAMPDGQRARFRTMMGQALMDEPARLRALLQTVPPSAIPALLRAIAISEAGYQQVLESLGQ
ncbi:MAG: DUF5667 domain-containing protein [Chloroflexota bacterium]